MTHVLPRVKFRTTIFRSLVAAAAFAVLTAATAQALSISMQSPLEGRWHQTWSNAGNCADCTVTISPIDSYGTKLLVEASNGWTALIFKDPDDFVAIGAGAWSESVGGLYGGKFFELNATLEEGSLKLFMDMVDPEFATPVEAAFVRMREPLTQYDSVPRAYEPEARYDTVPPRPGAPVDR